MIKTIREQLLDIDKKHLGTNRYKDLTTQYELNRNTIDRNKLREALNSKNYWLAEKIVLSEGIERYSDVIPKEERKFWYFTTHGVQPGSIPKGLNVLEIKDTPNGTFVALDGILNTSELRRYDMVEKAPLEETLLTGDDSEFDYFNVYDNGKLVGEYSSYTDAKENCKSDSCVINGVIQYGEGMYEETPLE